MKLFTRNLPVLFFSLLMLMAGSRAEAQCAFTSNARSGCVPFLLQLTAPAGSTNTNWTIKPTNGPLQTYTGQTQVSYVVPDCGTVIVTMTNGQGCNVVDSNFHALCKPVIKGQLSTNVTCANACVYWRDSSVNGGCPGPLHYLISWGAGTLDTIPNICHKYNPAGGSGQYSPAIVVTNSCGCQADTTYVNAINVTSPPHAAFTGTNLTSCASPIVSVMNATAVGNHTKYYWYVTSSGSAFSLTPNQANGSNVFSHSYGAGNWDIKLVTVDTLSGCSDSTVQNAYVQAGNAASACFTGNYTQGCGPANVSFCPCTPVGPNGPITYQWIFPAATPPTIVSTTNSCVTAFFPAGQRADVSLVVQYTGGCTDTLKQHNFVSLGNRYNLAAQLCNPSDTFSCIVPDTICVNYTGNPCPSCTFSWSPSPNSSPSNTPVSHTGANFYVNSFGSFTYSVNVTDTFGCSQTLIQTNAVTLGNLQGCHRLVPKHTSLCARDTLLFINCTLGYPFPVEIDSFPGATLRYKHGDTIELTYPNAGCHKLSVIMRNAAGCGDTIRDTICTLTKPTVTMTYTPKVYCYEADSTGFLVSVVGTDTPTLVKVWPEGISDTLNFHIDKNYYNAPFGYTYPDWGDFAVCFQANNNGCLGDTVCMTRSIDSLHIHPPAGRFTTVTDCRYRDSLLYINTSTGIFGVDSIIWNVNHGPNIVNKDSIYVPMGPCGTKTFLSLTAFNTNYGCQLTKVDSVSSAPCYGIDFHAPQFSCAPYLLRFPNAFYASSTSYQASKLVWAFPTSGAPAVFAGSPFIGDTVDPHLPVAGLYDAYLQVTYPNKCIDTIKKLNYIHVSKPVAGFRLSSPAGCIPFCVTFTDTSTYPFSTAGHFQYTFTDSNTIDSTIHNPTHCFNQVGRFNISLTVTDSSGCVSQPSTVSIQSDFIQAGFAASSPFTCTTSPDPRNPITFTDTSHGFVSTRQWVWTPLTGGGTLADVTNANPGNVSSFSTQFTHEGTYKLTLIATDIYNVCVDSVSDTVTVKNPVADYTFANLQDTFKNCPPVVITKLHDLSLNDICNMAWDYGDGSLLDPSDSPGHIWTIPGCYPLKHIVYSCHGCVDSITKYQICMNGPFIRVTSSAAGGCPPVVVHFYVESYACDSIQFTSGSGSSAPPFQYIGVHPRGTSVTQLAHDTFDVLYYQSGIVKPSLVAFDLRSGCPVPYDSIVLPLAIDSPLTDFSYHIYQCGYDSVCFTNLTHYHTTIMHDSIYAWDFGDGTTDNVANPCHKYARPGTYTVRFYVMSNYGCGDTMVKTIRVAKTPKASFYMDATIGCIPLLIHYTDTSKVDDSTYIRDAHWDFGDGTPFAHFSGAASDTNHTYTVANTTPPMYTATLVITDTFGCSDSTTQQIQVLGPPTYTKSPDVVICLGDSTTLSASGTSRLIWVTTYNIDTTNNLTPIVWPRVDTFYVFQVGILPRCLVFDTIRVGISTITATASTIDGHCFGHPTTFTGHATTVNSTIASSGYAWNYGDGSTGTGQTSSHTFATIGAYMDTLIVTNVLGCKDTLYDNLVIADTPHASMSVPNTSVCLGQPFVFTNTSVHGNGDSLSSFYWDVQSTGAIQDSVSPFSYTYPQAGTYTITLTQTDTSHCISTTSMQVFVRALPTAAFTLDSNCINQANTYTSTSTQGTGNITYYNWVIDRPLSMGGPIDSSLGIDSSIAYHTFVDSGYYNVGLAIRDQYGCYDSTYHIVHVLAQPIDVVTPLDTTICAGYSAAFNVSGPEFDRVQWVPSAWVNHPDSPNVVITPLQTTSYLVYSYYRTCQPKVDTVNIWVVDSIPLSVSANPTNIILGLSSNVTSTVKGTIDSIIWSPDSTLNCQNCFTPVATPHQTTTYTATIYYSRIDTVKKDTFTCTNKATVTITVFPNCNGSMIYVPNTFTPSSNSGLHNDLFRLRGEGIIKVNYFRVYDRWGKLVYDASNVDNADDAAWNGGYLNNLDNLESTGVYAYLFEIKCVTGQTVTGKGNVTLIR